LNSNHNQIPRVITVDKNPAYPPTIDELKDNKILPNNVSLRQIKYLNNIIGNYSAYVKQHHSLSSLNFNEQISMNEFYLATGY
jgi:transposase-like protein